MSSNDLYLCKTHNKKYVGYCESCNSDICLLCTSKHENHELLQYNEIQPSSKKVEELKQKFIDYKKNNKLLIEKLKLWLGKINHHTNKILEILENNEKVYESVLNNYDEKNINFEGIDNMNQIRKKGLIFGYKNINLDMLDINDDKILEKSDLVIKTIKDMEIEELFWSIKNQKNIIQNQNNINTQNKNSEKEKNEKKSEDKDNKDSKDSKKKKSKKVKSKKNTHNKDNEKEILMKKYEDFKEINLKSNYFDTEYLINLETSKKTKEELQNDIKENNSDSYLIKSIHNGREINNLSLIIFENKKYIVTSGYCYINIYDIKGQHQRTIKLHESDITNIIQLKNGNLLSSCIDGTMKIFKLNKNEGYTILQTIDTTKIKQENNNNIFSNNQLYVLLQLNKNEDIITSHGNNLLFYNCEIKEEKINYKFDQILSINKQKKENDYDFIINNKSISSLIEINNNEKFDFIATNNSSIFFIGKEKDKYIIQGEIKDLCGNGGPNNIIYYNDNIILAGGNKIYFINIKEQKIINEIKFDCCGINCINNNIKKNNDLIYIGYENKENKFIIGQYILKNNNNEYNIEMKKEYKNTHNQSISNIIPINLDGNEIKEQNELNNDNIKIEMISGSHDKYIKFWA